MEAFNKTISALIRKKIKYCLTSSVILSVLFTFSFAWIPGSFSEVFTQSPWTQGADMQNIRQGHSSGVLEGMIYVVGGVQYNTASTHFNALKGLEFYDPELDTWTVKADMDTGRVQFPTCVYDGKIYAIGGGQSVYWDPLKSIEVYNPETNTWTTITDMPRKRMGHTASLVNGKIYVIGGTDTNTNDMTPIAEIDVYDPLAETWDSTKADLLTPRLNLQAVVLNGKIYVLGGHRGSANNEQGLRTVEEYDPVADTWTTKAEMIWPRKYFTACSMNERIYVFGGARSCSKAWSSVEVYDPLTDTWWESTPLSEPWVMAAAAPFNEKVYVSGGTFVICPPDVQGTLRIYNPNEIVSIPDTAFLHALIEEGVDTNGDSLISYGEAEAIASLDVGGPDDVRGNISNLTGIEAFINLDSLFCGANSIDTLNISSLSQLVYLHCGPNQLNTLDVSKNTALRYLSCGANPFTSLDLSTCTALETLDCHGNQLTNLDLSNNTSLTSISLGCSNLHEVCVWTLPFPPEGVYVDAHYNDSICFEMDCNGVCEYDPTGIAKCDETGWIIFPNPAKNLLTIETEHYDNYLIEITTTNGQLVYNDKFVGTFHQTNISSFKRGTYILKILSRSNVATSKIIKY